LDSKKASTAGSYLAFPAVPEQNPWLDFLRAIAVLLVLMRHGERAITQADPTAASPLHIVFMNGWSGVDLFFVLSGYLITSQLLHQGIGSQSFALGRYIASRALRILPAYYAVLILTVAGAFPFYAIPQEQLGIRVVYHVLLLQDYLPANINVVFWSLGVEEKFYLLAPIVVGVILACKTNRIRISIFAFCVLAAMTARWLEFMSQSDWTYDLFFSELRSPFHMSLEPLAVGTALGVWHYHCKLPRVDRNSTWMWISFGLFLLFLSSHEFMAAISTWDVLAQPLLISMFCGVLVLVALSLSETQLPLTGGFRVIARLSYALYLVHFPLLPLAVTLSKGYSTPIFWGVFFLLSATTAAFLHFTVEKPFLLLKDRIGRTGNAAPISRTGNFIQAPAKDR
jgi:peptidoglycan/LPS O-acetylase OafA/YrhL